MATKKRLPDYLNSDPSDYYKNSSDDSYGDIFQEAPEIPVSSNNLNDNTFQDSPTNNNNIASGGFFNKVSNLFNKIPSLDFNSNTSPTWGKNNKSNIGNGLLGDISSWFNKPSSESNTSNIGNGILKNNFSVDLNTPSPTWGDNSKSDDWNKWTDMTANAAKSGFYGSLDGTLNMVRTGARAADEYLGDGEDGTFINWLNGAHNYLSDKTQSYDNQLKDIKPYSVEDFVNQGIKGAVQVGMTMAPGMGLGKVGQALGWGGKAVNTARMLPFGFQAGGNYASQAENDGASKGQQLAYGLAGMAGETASEAMFGLGPLINKFGKQGAKELINSGADTLMKKYGKLGLSYAKNVLGEATQEAIIDPVMGLAEKGIYNPNKNWTGENGVFDTSQMGQDAFGGAAMSVMLSALGLPSNMISHRKASYMIENNIKPTPNIINDIHNQQILDIQTIQAPQVNPNNAIVTNGQTQQYPSVFNTNNLNIQNNNQSNNPYNLSNIDTSKISYPVNNNTNPIIQPTLTKPTMTQVKNTPQTTLQTAGITPNNTNTPIENEVAQTSPNEQIKPIETKVNTNIETPKTIEAGQQYKLKNLGEVTIKANDGKLITVKHKSGRDIQIGKDGFSKLNPQFITTSNNIETPIESENIQPQEEIKETNPKGTYDIYRRDNSGKDLSANNKAHGMYYSLVNDKNTFKSPHEEIGDTDYWDKATPKNPLVVETGKIQHKRFRGVGGNGDISSGVSALKTLTTPEEFKRLQFMPKQALAKELHEKFPGYDYDHYYDSYELLEAYGAQLAKQKGYDAIIQEDKKMPEFSEYVSLNDEALHSRNNATEKSQREERQPSQPTTPIEEKPSQKASKDNSEHKVYDLVKLNNDEAGAITKSNEDGTYEIQKENGDYILAKKNGDTFEIIKSEPTPKEQIPLDERTSTNVGNRKVMSYQYLHPELKSHIQDDAEALLKDLKETSKGERGTKEDGSTWGSQRVTSDDIAYLRDSYKMSYADIEKGLKALIEDNGSENIAASKKIELVIDHRLSNGYKDMMGNDIEANKDYVSKKNSIEGKNVKLNTDNGEKSNQQQDKEDLQSKEKPQEQPKEENPLVTISKFNDRFRKGEPLTLEEVKNHAELVMNNKDGIKSELNKLTNKELDKMIGVWSSGRYSKKQDKVEHIYDNQLNRTYYNIANTDTLSGLTFGGKSIEEQMRDKIKASLEKLTQEKLDKILEENKNSYNKAIEERKAKIESIKNPTTLSEFEEAKRYRKLTADEQRQYEELKALDIKSKEKDKETKTVTNLESNGEYEISKTQDTRDKRDLWVVKFKDKSGDFKSLNQQMKDLGGTGYSRFTRGFNFYFDPVEKLGTLKNGDTVETSKDETKPNREKNVADKLRTVADNMQKTIDYKFGDRKTNTAKRANEAANAEREGEALKKQQQIIRNIADLIESGQAIHLDGVSARTHIETLENILRRTINEIVSKMINEKYPSNSGTYGVKKQYEEELKSNSEVEFNSIDIAEYPLTKTYDETLKQLVKETINIPGTARLRQKIDKAIVQNKVKGMEHYINTKNIADDIIELYDKLKRSGKDFSRDYDLVDYKRLQTMGIKNTTMLRAALREFYKAKGNFELSPEETQAKKVKELERSIVGRKIESYFPTPKKIVNRMLEEANIQEGEKILEPSAGSGHIADMIKEEYPNNKLEVGEYNSTLSSILEEKGHNVVSKDFLEHKGSYDKIIMNPPFEKNQDIIHVQHAYDLLKPGGRIVAITSEHPFFANDKKSVEFREWLDELGGVSEKLPEGSFKESDRSTGVNTRMVVIDKPLGTKKAKGTKAFMGANANTASNNGEGQTLPRKQIIDNLIKELDIPNRLGRISNRGALGIYKERAEVIRTKAAEDIPTLSHEIGHHLDKKYNLSKLIKNNSVFKKEILKLGEEQAKLQKLDTDGQISEGIAEFVRLYLSSEDVSPYQFTAMFEKVIGKKFANTLNTFRSEYNKYLNASSGNRILSHVDFGDSRKSLKEKTKENIEDFKENSFDKFYTTWVDELRPLYNLSKQGKSSSASSDPYKMAWLFRGWSGKAIGAIKYGVYNYNSKGKLTKVSEGLNDILKPIKAKDMDEFRKYIIAKRVIEKENQKIRTGFDLIDAKNVVKEVEETNKNTDFITAYEGLQNYQDSILRRLVDSGLMSEEQYSKIKELNKDYVPFYRALNTEEGVSQYTGDTFGNIKSPVKKMKGSNASIVDPIESIVKNTYYFTNLAERNLVAQSLVKFSEENEGMGKYIENVTPKMSVTKFELKEIKKSLEDANFDIEDADLKQFAAVFRPIMRGSASENIITVSIDGKPKLYQLDAEIYKSVMGLDKESSNLVFKIANMATKTLRAGAVLNPEFAARNLTRDALGAFIYSKYHFIPVLDTLKGLKHVLKKDEAYNLWLNSGAAQSDFVSLDRDYLSKGVRGVLSKGKPKELLMDFLKNPLEPLRYLSSLSEESTRLGHFAKGLKKEGNSREGLAELGLNTRDLTLDFSRSGTSGKNANKIVAFFNATIQGQDKMLRTFKNPQTRNAALIKSLIGVTLPSILLWFKYHDDDKIKELPLWRKDLFWNIPTENYVISIPKPFELGIIFGSLPERMLDYFNDKDPKAMKAWGEDFLGNMLPNVLPTGMQPIIEAITNYSFFTGLPIENMTDKNAPAYQRYSASTSLLAKKLGEAAKNIPGLENGVSPKKIDNTIRGYTAGLGQYGVNAIDKVLGNNNEKPASDLRQIPGVKGFLTEPYSQARTVEDFYTAKGELKTKYDEAIKKFKSENPNIDDKEWTSILKNDITPYKEKKVAKLPSELSQLHKQTYIYDKVGDYLSNVRDQEQAVYSDESLSAAVKQGKINELHFKTVQYLKNLNSNINDNSINSLMNQFKPKKK